MPPTPAAAPEQRLGSRDALERTFARAATQLTELYKESTNAYEAGYHDALLYVQRYVLLTSPSTENASAQPLTSSTALPVDRATAYTTAPVSTIRTDKILQFLQTSAERRRQRVNAARGTSTYRRRLTREGPEVFNREDTGRYALGDGVNDADATGEYASSSASTNGVSEEMADIDADSLEAEMWELCMPYQRRRLEEAETR